MDVTGTLARWWPSGWPGRKDGPQAAPVPAADASPLDQGPAGYVLTAEAPVFRPAFSRLYRAFQAGQWHPDDGSIDWTREPVVEDLFVYREQARELRAYFVADFYCGEAFTLRGAGRRLDALDQADEKCCYALMIGDEHRHAEVFGRYQRKLGSVRPPDPRLIETLEWAETLDVEAFILGAMILETIAVHAMPAMWRSTRDPLLNAFLPKLHKDECRHEAFSHLYLAARAPRWTAERRRALGTLAGEMFERQERYMLERNPEIPFEIPAPIQAGIDFVAKRSLGAGARSIASRLEALGMAVPERVRAWC